MVDVLATSRASSKRIAKRPTHITLFDVNVRQLEKYKKCLKLCYLKTEEADKCDD